MPARSGADGAEIWLSKAAAKVLAEKQKKGAAKARRRAHVELVDIAVNGCRAGDAALVVP